MGTGKVGIGHYKLVSLDLSVHHRHDENFRVNPYIFNDYRVSCEVVVSVKSSGNFQSLVHNIT